VSSRIPLWAPEEWRRGLALRLGAISESPSRISVGFAVGAGVACTPLIGLHFVLAVFGAIATRSSVPAAVLGSFAANPWTYPLTLAGGYAIGSRLLGLSTAGAIENTPSLLVLLRAILVGDWSMLSAFGPIFGATILGGTILGLAVGGLAYLAARAMLRPLIPADPI